MRPLFYLLILSLIWVPIIPSLAIGPDGRLDDFEEDAVRGIVNTLKPTGTLRELGGEDVLTLILESTNGLLPSSDDLSRAAVSVFLADEGLLEEGAAKATASRTSSPPTDSMVAALEADALLARTLQEQLTLEREEEERWAVHAAAATAEEQRRRDDYATHRVLRAERQMLFSPHRTALTDIFDACRPYAEGDVHAFNKGIVRVHYPTVQKIDAILFHDEMTEAEAISPADTIAQISTFAAEHDLSSRFPRAAEYFPVIMRNRPGVIEAETGIDPLMLFPRLWRLAQATDDDPFKTHQFQLPDHSIVDARTFLYYSLHENYAEQGGCWPGFAGRLFQVYLQILSSRIS